MTGHVWTEWSFQPFVLAGLVTAGLAYGRGVRRLWRGGMAGRGVSPARAWAFFGGMGTLFLLLVSPVDTTSEILLSAHMIQHIGMVMVAAPLLVLGRPVLVILQGLPVPWRRALHRVERRRAARAVQLVLGSPVVAWFLHVVVLWAWHVPRAYQDALGSEAVHAAEHATFLLTALLFWALVLQPGELRRLPRGADVLFLLTAWLQSGALGALFALAPSPVYPAYVEPALALGISPLADQQLAGLIMWIPAGAIYLGGACAAFVGWLRATERTTRRLEARAAEVTVGGPPGVGR